MVSRCRAVNEYRKREKEVQIEVKPIPLKKLDIEKYMHPILKREKPKDEYQNKYISMLEKRIEELEQELKIKKKRKFLWWG